MGKVNTPVISEFECIELNIVIITEFDFTENDTALIGEVCL
jgi:hypothetical protein